MLVIIPFIAVFWSGLKVWAAVVQTQSVYSGNVRVYDFVSHSMQIELRSAFGNAGAKLVVVAHVS